MIIKRTVFKLKHEDSFVGYDEDGLFLTTMIQYAHRFSKEDLKYNALADDIRKNITDVKEVDIEIEFREVAK